MRECTKAAERRISDPNFVNRYFVGEGIDIGSGSDSLEKQKDLWPNIKSIRTWDLIDGDAQFMAEVKDESYDFVHSSHCLEHMMHVPGALKHWWRILRPGGYLIIMVPDEDLYEQGIFPPSSFNRDHKWTFTIWKPDSWTHRTINVIQLICFLGPTADIHKIELLDAHYDYGAERIDQSTTPAECGIEFVVRKRPEEEIKKKGRYPEPDSKSLEDRNRPTVWTPISHLKI